MADIELIKKDGTSIFEKMDMSGGMFYARKWGLTEKNTIFSCRASYPVDDLDEQGKPRKNELGKTKRKMKTEDLIYDIKKELLLLTVNGITIFPKFEQQEEDYDIE